MILGLGGLKYIYLFLSSKTNGLEQCVRDMAEGKSNWRVGEWELESWYLCSHSY